MENVILMKKMQRYTNILYDFVTLLFSTSTWKSFILLLLQITNSFVNDITTRAIKNTISSMIPENPFLFVVSIGMPVKLLWSWIAPTPFQSISIKTKLKVTMQTKILMPLSKILSEKLFCFDMSQWHKKLIFWTGIMGC